MREWFNGIDESYLRSFVTSSMSFIKLTAGKNGSSFPKVSPCCSRAFRRPSTRRSFHDLSCCHDRRMHLHVWSSRAGHGPFGGVAGFEGGGSAGAGDSGAMWTAQLRRPAALIQSPREYSNFMRLAF
jgi:hypothetical protein